MLSRLFPTRVDNDYRGHPAAPWLMGVLVLMKLAMGVNATFNTHYGVRPTRRPPAEEFDLAGTLAALDADVVVLQEVWRPDRRRGRVDEVQLNTARLIDASSTRFFAASQPKAGGQARSTPPIRRIMARPMRRPSSSSP